MAFGIWDLVLLIATLFGILLIYAWNKNKYFQNQGVEFLTPLPFVGNMLKVSLGQEHGNELTARTKEQYPNNKYVGIYNFMIPTIVVWDLELLRKIMVKDFTHFVDHMKFTDEEVDPLTANILFSLTGDKWREMRTTLSPAFTSSKMRAMVPFIIECTDTLMEYLKKKCREPSAKSVGYAEIDTKEIISRYANDSIASCAFGCKIDSINDKDNDFFKAAKDSVTFNVVEMAKVFFYFMCPSIYKFFKFETKKWSSNFFRKLVTGNIRDREEKKIVRQDMIHLLMLAKQGALRTEEDTDHQNEEKPKKTKWTDDELTAQALLFIFAGLDSTSNAICAILQQITVNPELQSKLRNEIDDYLNSVDGKIDYSGINSLKYLDMVISEALRLYPSVPILDRKCVKNYLLPPANDEKENSFVVKKDDDIWIPIYNIQRDSKYFNDPEKFDPERFSDDNKKNIDPFTYMPFGYGPRICIGSRFALMEMKILTIYLLKNFDVVPTPKTSRKIKIKPHLFEMIPETGYWMGLIERNKS